MAYRRSLSYKHYLSFTDGKIPRETARNRRQRGHGHDNEREEGVQLITESNELSYTASQGKKLYWSNELNCFSCYCDDFQVNSQLITHVKRQTLPLRLCFHYELLFGFVAKQTPIADPAMRGACLGQGAFGSTGLVNIASTTPYCSFHDSRHTDT